MNKTTFSSWPTSYLSYLKFHVYMWRSGKIYSGKLSTPSLKKDWFYSNSANFTTPSQGQTKFLIRFYRISCSSNQMIRRFGSKTWTKTAFAKNACRFSAKREKASPIQSVAISIAVNALNIYPSNSSYAATIGVAPTWLKSRGATHRKAVWKQRILAEN